jgi:hypothetical protein
MLLEIRFLKAPPSAGLSLFLRRTPPRRPSHRSEIRFRILVHYPGNTHAVITVDPK